MDNLGNIIEFFSGIIVPLFMALCSIVFKWYCNMRNKLAKQTHIFINYKLYQKLINIMIGMVVMFWMVAMLIGGIDLWFERNALQGRSSIWLLVIGILAQWFFARRVDYYGLDKNGNAMNYKKAFYITIILINITLLWSFKLPMENSYIYFGILFMQIVIIGVFSFYCMCIKKISWCKCITIKLVNGESLVVPIKEYNDMMFSGISIIGQKGKKMIKEEQIVYRDVEYTQEYEEWMKKLEQKKDISEKDEKERDVYIRWIIVAVAFSVMVMIGEQWINSVNHGFVFEAKQEFIKIFTRFQDKDDLVSELFSHQLTISTIFISVISVVINNLEDRYVGVSSKGILFKRYLYNPNYLTLVCIILAMDGVAIVAYFMESRIGLTSTFLVTVICMFVMLMFSYNVVSKKSKVYKKMRKRLEKKDSEHYKLIINNLKQMVSIRVNEVETSYNAYFEDEMRVLYQLKLMAKQKEDIIQGQAYSQQKKDNLLKQVGEEKEIIKSRVMWLLIREQRDVEKLKELEAFVKKKNGKEICNWLDELNCCREEFEKKIIKSETTDKKE